MTAANISLSPREVNTILAALRLWQLVVTRTIGLPAVLSAPLDAVATNEGAEEPLDHEAIDVLCERINTV